MSKISVTASVTYDYDTEDGVVTDQNSALEDVKDMLDSGDISSGQFEFSIKEDFVGSALAELDAFRAKCEGAEYTDTGEAWAMIDKLEDALRGQL